MRTETELDLRLMETSLVADERERCRKLVAVIRELYPDLTETEQLVSVLTDLRHLWQGAGSFSEAVENSHREFLEERRRRTTETLGSTELEEAKRPVELVGDPAKYCELHRIMAFLDAYLIGPLSDIPERAEKLLPKYAAQKPATVTAWLANARSFFLEGDQGYTHIRLVETVERGVLYYDVKMVFTGSEQSKVERVSRWTSLMGQRLRHMIRKCLN
jgi:hypothetical protein